MCCQGVNSTYNVRLGRSTSVSGPFVDESGVNLLSGGGSLFLSSEGNYIGPGQVGIALPPWSPGPPGEDGKFARGLAGGQRSRAGRPAIWDTARLPMLLTRAESTGFRETSLHADVMAFVAALNARSSRRRSTGARP